ncbi:Multidrug resistance protein [Dirofilaria immitis]
MGTSRNINEIKGTDRILSLSVIKSDKSGKLTKNGYDLQSSSIEKRLKKSSGWRTSSKINDLKNEMGISDLQAIQAFIFKRCIRDTVSECSSWQLSQITCWHTVCERQIHQIHFAAVLQQNMDWFDTHPSGELITEIYRFKWSENGDRQVLKRTEQSRDIRSTYGTKLYNDGFIKPAVVFATFWATISGTLSLDIAAPQVGVVITAQTAASSIFEIINRSTIDGIPFDSMNIQWLRQMIGLVSQEPILFATTVEENIRLGNEKMITEDMERGYKTHIGSEDEAITALDTKSEKIVQHALEKTTVERITFTMAHRLSTIRNMDHIIVLDHGKVIERGTNEELMARGNIYMKLKRKANMAKVFHSVRISFKKE